MRWNKISAPWQAVLEEAWSAYRAGAFPVGAALADEAGLVVARGRNTVRGERPREGILHGNKLCHAEINALLSINESQHPGYRGLTLYSSLEPCPLCFGALAMSKISRCRFAARDPVGGSTALADANGFLRSRLLKFEGPVLELEPIQIALLSEFVLRERPAEADYLLSRWQESSPAGVARGKRIFELGLLCSPRRDGTEISDVIHWLGSGLTDSDVRPHGLPPAFPE